MGNIDKLKGWFFEDEPAEEDSLLEEVKSNEEVDEQPKISAFEKSKSAKVADAVKALNANKDSHLVLFEPRAYGECQEIATYLKQKKATVVNLHRLNINISKRVIDFLTGVIFAIDGDIQKIGPNIFLCTPKNIGVSGNITMEPLNTDEE